MPLKPLTAEEWKSQIEGVDDPTILNMICKEAETNPAYDEEAGTGEGDDGEKSLDSKTSAKPEMEVIPGAKARGIPPSQFPVASDDPDM